MRVIITGGTGLVGSALAENLVRDQHEVIVLSRSPERKADQIPAGATAVKWDARSASGWGHLAEGADAIVNLAGENLAGEGFLPSRWSPSRKRTIRESRLNAGKAVTEAVENAEKKPRVVIQPSAVGYYGASGDEKITEEDPPGEDYLARVCVDWEASTARVKEWGVRQVIIRSAGIILSKDSGALPRFVLPHRFFVGGPFGDGQQWHTWIHPADEVEVIRFLIDQEEAEGPFNVMAPNPVRDVEFGRTIGSVLNRPSWFPVPGFAMRLAFGEVADVVLTGQRVLPDRLQEFGYTFQFPQLEPALRDILR
jgi:uncharacterized protein (TIGR01777 family)